MMGKLVSGIPKNREENISYTLILILYINLIIVNGTLFHWASMYEKEKLKVNL